MYIKIHESYRKVVAMCDSEVIGNIYEEGKMQLDVRETFYKGEEVGDDIVNELKIYKEDDATFSIVGEKSIKLALESGIITKDNVGEVKGVPFALILS